MKSTYGSTHFSQTFLCSQLFGWFRACFVRHECMSTELD
jgi:hypothetical protein